MKSILDQLTDILRTRKLLKPRRGSKNGPRQYLIPSGEVLNKNTGGPVPKFRVVFNPARQSKYKPNSKLPKRQL